jgi:putative hemolysin
MTGISHGRYHVRFSTGQSDIVAAQRLRWRAFRARGQDDGVSLDADDFDAICTHVLVERQDGLLAACFRLLPLASGREIARSYSAQYYNLSRLAGYDAPAMEMGRFCIDPDLGRDGPADPDIIRAAWAALASHVEAAGTGLLFGCSSFRGTDAEAHAEAFALLRDRHLAPRRWLPRVKAPSVFRFARHLRLRAPDPRLAARAMPPLLRSYLLMGGWVSDHAVIDRDLDTLHVFTGLEIGRVPAARRRLLLAA